MSSRETESQDAAWPTSITVSAQGRILTIGFASGESYILSAELLRVESPSAEVKGHGPGQETLQWGKANVRITLVEPVGNYAVRLHFSDGHATGIYTWPYLQKLGREGERLMAEHLAALSAAGLAR